MKILFVLKFREQPYSAPENDWSYSYSGTHLSSGLFNSANMIVRMLNDQGHDAKLVHVVDGNSIHKECVAFKPDVCVIEAFWCPPFKFDDLYKVLPNLKFIVRNHSETPFLANEGIAYQWMIEYCKKPNVFIAPNSKRMAYDTEIIFKAAGIDKSKILYLPNFYYFGENGPLPSFSRPRNVINVGCFGAVRPLKNHMEQAVAALAHANKKGVSLRFHINGNRVEGNGAPILKNLRQMFAQLPEHELVEHEWTDATVFRKMLRTLDAVMQCSFSETFNIVAADSVDAGVPVVGSKEIFWLTDCLKADPTDVKDIEAKLDIALGFRGPSAVFSSRYKLQTNNNGVVKQWQRVLADFVAKPAKKWKFFGK